MINLKHLKNSFKHAFHGVVVVIKSEQSFRIQLLAGAVALILSAYFTVKTFELLIILLMIGFVMSLELINSIIERLVDSFKPRIHPAVKEIKDIMAATVLLASVLALIVGVVIFYPYFQELLV